MKRNQGLTYIGLLAISLVAIVLLLVVNGVISSRKVHKNQDEQIPSIVLESHALEATENAEILLTAIDEWTKKYSFKSTNNIDDPTIHFTGTDVVSPKGRVYAKRAENAPDLGCIPSKKKQTQYCETPLFTYEAACFPNMGLCHVEVYEKGKERFSLEASTDPVTKKWNKVCTINEENSEGNELCSYLHTKGWTYIPHSI